MGAKSGLVVRIEDGFLRCVPVEIHKVFVYFFDKRHALTIWASTRAKVSAKTPAIPIMHRLVRSAADQPMASRLARMAP